MNPKYKIYLTSIIFFIIFCAEVFGLIPFLLSKINFASADLAKKKQNFESIQKKAQQTTVAEDEYQAIKPRLDEINNSLLDRSRVLDFIMVLEKIARETGNQDEISIANTGSNIKKPADKKQSDETMEFQVSLSGIFPDLIKFLSKVENMPYLNDIDNIQIRGYGGEGNGYGTEGQLASNAIETTLNIKVYLKQ
jgi:hypothetical protein